MTSPGYDLVIRGGTVATATDVFEADVGIAGESIVGVLVQGLNNFVLH